MAKKETIFQKLNKALGVEANGPKYVIDPTNIAKIADKGEYETKKLEAQQTLFLQNQWKKIDNELYQKAVYYEPTRFASYYDYESMEYCIHGDTKIATPNGFITIKELSDKGRDHEFIVYAYDHNLKRVVPAMARNAHYTRDEMTYKTTFDDGSFIITTWEHQLMKRDGSFERVMNLKVNDSMMPFYRKSFYNNQKYNWVYSCNSESGHNGWISEHNLVAEWFYETKISDDQEVHHIDFNGKNNDPSNLAIMNISEHRGYHARLNNEKLWANEEYRNKMSEVARRKGKFNWDGKRSGENNPAFFSVPFDNIIETARIAKTLKQTAKLLNVSYRKIQRDIVNSGYSDWQTFLEAYGIQKSKYSTAKAKDEVLCLNHKIVSIEPHGVIPVYDLTVPNYKNFATDTIFSHNTPEIAVALDIFADEATTGDENGKILRIYSESTRIKEELTRLFEDVLDINTNLTSWARNICKYGDNFIYNKIVPNVGIVGCMQLPNVEITRSEPGFAKVQSMDEYNTGRATKFFWKDKNIEFNSFEISHFRLLGDDRRLPYGTCLKGDTRVTTEYSVKEIKDVCEGDLVWSFDTETQEKVLSKVLDKVNSGVKTCYKVSTKHNFIDASEEHRVMVVDNNEFIYKNVCDIKIGDFLVIDSKVSTSNNIIIDKTPPDDNKNGWFNQCDTLIPDFVTEEFAQLFGFLIGDGWLGTSSQTISIALGVDNDINEYYIDLLKKFSNNDGAIVNRQFICYSKLLKTILERMGFGGKFNEKRIPNWVFEANEEVQKSFIAGLFDADGWETEDKWTKAFHFELSNEQLIKDIKVLLQRLGYKCGKIGKRNRKENNKGIAGRLFKNVNDSYYIVFYDNHNKQTEKYDFKNRKNNNFIIEKVISIEDIGKHETFDIYVENDNHNFFANGVVVHNSLLEKSRRIWKQLLLSEDAMLVYRVTRAPERRVYKIYVGNMDDKDVDPYVDKIANSFKRVNMTNPENGNTDTRYNPLAVDQDYFIPVRDPQLTMPIETLPGAQNLSEIADIEYIQKKLLAALRVPKEFLGFDEATGEGKNLAILDIRFARAVHRVQKALIQELNKMAIIHLYAKGFSDDLDNFTLSLTNPSTQADSLKIANWKEKVSLYRDMVTDAGNGFGVTSMTRAKKELFGDSDDEIKLDLQRQAVEKAASEELKMIAETIKQTGIFRNVYTAYKINPENMAQVGATDQNDGLSGGGGGGGGGGFGGGADTNVGGDADMGAGADIAQDFTTPFNTDNLEAGGNAEALPDNEPIGEPEEELREAREHRLEKKSKTISRVVKDILSDFDKITDEK